MAGFGFIKSFLSPGYEVWEDWHEYYLEVCEVFMWTKEGVKRYLPGILCGWALDALNYFPHEFWKSDQKYHEWRLQETLYFFDLRLSNNPQLYEDAFERNLIEKGEYGKEALQCGVDRPVVQSHFVDRDELPRQERIPKSVTKKNVQVTTNIVKFVVTGKSAKGSLDKRWSAIKSIGFGVNAVLKEKLGVRDESQETDSKNTDNQPNVDTVADSKSGGSDGKFYSVRETEEGNVAKPKTGDEQFKELMDRCIARWDVGKNRRVAELGSEDLEETANSKLEDDAFLSEDDFSDDDSFFDSDDEINFIAWTTMFSFRTFVSGTLILSLFTRLPKTNSQWKKRALKGR